MMLALSEQARSSSFGRDGQRQTAFRYKSHARWRGMDKSLTHQANKKPRHFCRGSFGCNAQMILAAGAGTDHVVVEGVFGNLPPEIFVVAEGHHVVMNLLELRIFSRFFRIHFIGGLVASIHDFL